MRMIVAGAAVALMTAMPNAAIARDEAATAITIEAGKPGAKIDRHIFGQFAEHLGTGIYGGVWVGPDSTIPNVRGIRSDVVAALKAIKVPDVRWPGGCFADEYHWRDGVGPRRRSTINANWGGAIEPDLESFYRDNVIGGPGAFVIPAASFETFGDAILKKLIIEISEAESAKHLPLPILFQNGERVGVRGGQERRSKLLPLTLTLSP